MISSLNEQDLKVFLKAIDKDIIIKKESEGLYLYYQNRDMGIGIHGKLENGTDYTLEVLKVEIDCYFNERSLVKLILEEKIDIPRSNPKSKKQYTKRRSNKSNGSKDRF